MNITTNETTEQVIPADLLDRVENLINEIEEVDGDLCEYEYEVVDDSYSGHLSNAVTSLRKALASLLENSSCRCCADGE